MARIAAAVFTAVSWFCAPAFAANGTVDQAALEREMCATGKCQSDLRVTLRREDGTLYEGSFKVFPAIVQPMGIVVLAGQTVYIEADVAGDRLVNLAAVGIVTRPEKTITAKFEQNAQGGMLLTINNPFPKAIKFNMGMMPLKSERLVKTSSCPVGAGIALLEHWPFPIFQVVLGNARLLEKGDATACVN
jgi:hypothetical protein